MTVSLPFTRSVGRCLPRLLVEIDERNALALLGLVDADRLERQSALLAVPVPSTRQGKWPGRWRCASPERHSLAIWLVRRAIRAPIYPKTFKLFFDSP